MKIALSLLLVSSIATAQSAANSAATIVQTSAAPAPASVSSTQADPVLTQFLTQVQSIAQKTDTDIARLRIDKWKADSANKQQSEAGATSIRRNLTNAVPDLVNKIQTTPSSVNANFRLYRNLNVLYDAFFSLVESAGAFAPKEQYEPLADDIGQLDQLRHQLAERLDLLSGANDADLARLRAQTAAASAAASKPATKVVVDDEQPKTKKKAKSTKTTSQQ